MKRKEQKPLISVIIPAYNIEKWIAPCAASLFAQKMFKETEIIFVDDGSTDNTGREIEKVYKRAKKNVVILKNQRNYGVSAARNQAIDVARGGGIMFLDGDDEIGYNTNHSFDTGYLGKFWAPLTNPEIRSDIVIGNIVQAGDKRDFAFNQSAIYENHIVSDTIKLLKYVNRRVSACATLYNADTIKSHNLKFDTSLTYFEDTSFISNYILKMRGNCAVFISDAIYKYNYRANSAMHRLKSHSEEEMRRLTYINNQMIYYLKMIDSCEKKFGPRSLPVQLFMQKMTKKRRDIIEFSEKYPNSRDFYLSFLQYLPDVCRGCNKRGCDKCKDYDSERMLITGISDRLLRVK
ncbi:MAG: glycosyltransferase [Rickettsiales bacterium]|jgi:glycosyltransferase involved in cell wall biosynthesis|nr:glycosyltransferase [Rickettsiales bacterium]